MGLGVGHQSVRTSVLVISRLILLAPWLIVPELHRTQERRKVHFGIIHMISDDLPSRQFVIISVLSLYQLNILLEIGNALNIAASVKVSHQNIKNLLIFQLDSIYTCASGENIQWDYIVSFTYTNRSSRVWALNFYIDSQIENFSAAKILTPCCQLWLKAWALSMPFLLPPKLPLFLLLPKLPFLLPKLPRLPPL